MAKIGKFEFGEIERLAKGMKQVVDHRVIERWIRDLLLELAYRAESKIKRKTPVDTGDLRRRWTVGNVERRGDAYVVEITNNLEYASFVEYGHRTGKDLTGWAEGRFMATISMKEIERMLPGYIEKKQVELLEKIMGGKG
ncbi:HK97 gp10 family phage protein [Paenibacillus taichungensis]|uniref:HK97 gp10 family phage protein n=1 Tax=Paenibacillus taichungensis TaxID=484184 RepID=UPI0037F97141